MDKRIKKKTFSSIAKCFVLLLFLSSWVVLGVALAVKQADVNVSGSVTFKATGIYAQIRGTVTGTETTNTPYTADFNHKTTQEESTKEWKNLMLDFTDDNLITIKIEIDNLAEKRLLYATFTDNIPTDNLIITRIQNGEKVEESKNFSSITIDSKDTGVIEIQLKVKNRNKGINKQFSFGVDLSSEEIKEANETNYPTISFTPDTTAKTMTISKGNISPIGKLTIPNKVIYNDELYTVTEIADNAFENSEITSVSFPSTLTKIGKSAFKGSSIQSLNISRNIFLCSYAFQYCKSLKSLILDNNQQGGGELWSGSVFAGCTSLESVTIKEGMKVLRESWFNSCHSLKSITLPNSLTHLSAHAFYKSGIESITIPANVEFIGKLCFNQCSNLKSVTFENPDGWTSNSDSLDLSNPEQNAILLKTTYKEYDWTRS